MCTYMLGVALGLSGAIMELDMGQGWLVALGGLRCVVFMMSPTIICSAATASTTAEARAGADCARAGGQRHHYKHPQQPQNAI